MGPWKLLTFSLPNVFLHVSDSFQGFIGQRRKVLYQFTLFLYVFISIQSNKFLYRNFSRPLHIQKLGARSHMREHVVSIFLILCCLIQYKIFQLCPFYCTFYNISFLHNWIQFCCVHYLLQISLSSHLLIDM